MSEQQLKNVIKIQERLIEELEQRVSKQSQLLKEQEERIKRLEILALQNEVFLNGHFNPRRVSRIAKKRPF
jgi:hypothetical protein